MRVLASALVALALLAACGDDDSAGPPTAGEATTSTTTLAPADPLDQDRRLIVGMFRAISDAYAGGTDAGAQAEVDNAYPGHTYTAADCRGDLPDGAVVEIVVDQATLEPDPGWVVPGGPLMGTAPEGRVYIMQLRATYVVPDYSPEELTYEGHATVIDGRAYQFPNCEP